jgi:hypothetical protein
MSDEGATYLDVDIHLHRVATSTSRIYPVIDGCSTFLVIFHTETRAMQLPH